MLFICVGLAYASDSYSQNVLLNIDVNNKSVQEVLDEIEKQSDFHFFYNNKQVSRPDFGWLCIKKILL